jgi:catechol 2,3-dioxygenase-like lactoylglutathione lyase family enzyme
MIKGAHAMFYSPKAEELRAFVRDKLGFSYTDVGGGWLIFDLPQAELGCHPDLKNSHGISFYCDDIHKTMQELKAKGVEFTSEVTDQGFGLVTTFKAPGDMTLSLYEPKYKLNAR